MNRILNTGYMRVCLAIATVFALVQLFLPLFPPEGLADHVNGLPMTPKVGFSSRVFPEVDQRDAQVAMELWTRELARGMGIKTSPQTIIYKKTDDLIDAVKRGELTVVTLPATEFLKIRDKAPMTPAIIAGTNAGNARQYTLIVRRDSRIKSISDMRGRVINIPTETKNEASHIWLHVLLMREVKQNRTLFFRQVRENNAASQSILGVFFKQADAAIVSRGAFETCKALNPQVGRELTVIAESKPLLGDIICIPNMVDTKLKRSIENAALHLHETAAGRQMFTLFQIDRTILFKPSYIEGLTELLRERDRLLVKQAKRR